MDQQKTADESKVKISKLKPKYISSQIPETYTNLDQISRVLCEI